MTGELWDHSPLPFPLIQHWEDLFSGGTQLFCQPVTSSAGSISTNGTSVNRDAPVRRSNKMLEDGSIEPIRTGSILLPLPTESISVCEYRVSPKAQSPDLDKPGYMDANLVGMKDLSPQ